MTKTSLPASIRSLVDRIEVARELTPAATRDFLDECDVTPADLEPWTDFGHPKADSYGRRLVYNGGFFELMVMSWIDGDISAIHDHGHTQWGAVRLYGNVEHATFKLENGVLTTGDRRMFSPGSVIAVGHDLVHQMGNVGQEPYLTLHLYGCYGRDGTVTGDARLHDLDEGKIRFTDGGAFFDLPESQISHREDCPPADFPTYLRHQVELLKRMMARDDVVARRRFGSQRQERLAAELFEAATWHGFSEEWNRMCTGPSLRLDHYTRILYRELQAVAALWKQLADAGLTEPAFSAVRLNELLAFSDLDQFAEGYLELVSDTYSLSLASLAAA